MAESNPREEEGLTGAEENEMKLSRKEKKKLAKRMRRKEKRKEMAEKEREEEEARANDPEELRKLEIMEKEEQERRERALKEFEERERIWIEKMELKKEEERRKLLELQQEEEEEEAKKQLQVGRENECDEDDDWEYVEEGPAEIIWQGNEIIIRKKKVRVPKKDANQLSGKEDTDRPTSNPLPPQSEAFTDYQSAQQALETVARQVPNFGTELDKAHCPFHLKTGTCRFGQSCSRVHFYPDKSCTLLIKNMYNGPGLAWEQDEGLEYTDEEVERSYEEFYEDVHTEFLKFGEIVNFKVCRNGSFHLRGNVYVHYKSLESAVDAYHSVNGRFFAGKQIKCEFINVTRWKVAICGEYMKSRLKTCSHGTACNFIHCFRNPGGDYEWADWDKPAPKYWVKKMAALFGYSDESGYQKEMEQDYLGHRSRRSKSREMDHVKSGSRRSHYDEHDVWERARDQKYSNDNRKRIKLRDEKFREESTKFKDYHHSESRSNETNSDGSWSDRDKDRDRHCGHITYGHTKNRTDDESDSGRSWSDGERDTRTRHVHTKRSSGHELPDDNGDSENKTHEAHGDARDNDGDGDRERDHSHVGKKSRDRSKVRYLDRHGDNKIRNEAESTRDWSDGDIERDRQHRCEKKSSREQSNVLKFPEDDVGGKYKTSDHDSGDDSYDKDKERHHSHGRKRSRKGAHKHPSRRSHSRKESSKADEDHESSSSDQYDERCKSINKHDRWELVNPEGDRKSSRKPRVQSYESSSPGHYNERSKSQDLDSGYRNIETIDGDHWESKDVHRKHRPRSKSTLDDQDHFRDKSNSHDRRSSKLYRESRSSSESRPKYTEMETVSSEEDQEFEEKYRSDRAKHKSYSHRRHD